jgi:hypothetical protein
MRQALPPRGWEGTVNTAVCPGCQLAEWHPHCTSWLDDYGHGKRVAWRDEGGDDVISSEIAAMPSEEWDTESWAPCDYIDHTISWIDEADWPKQWRCPECGGTAFEGVHGDYPMSGLKGARFSVELGDADLNEET